MSRDVKIAYFFKEILLKTDDQSTNRSTLY